MIDNDYADSEFSFDDDDEFFEEQDDFDDEDSDILFNDFGIDQDIIDEYTDFEED